MEYMDYECEVCGGLIENVLVYGDFDCPNCKARYEYDEGQYLILTPETVKLLYQKHFPDSGDESKSPNRIM